MQQMCFVSATIHSQMQEEDDILSVLKILLSHYPISVSFYFSDFKMYVLGF